MSSKFTYSDLGTKIDTTWDDEYLQKVLQIEKEKGRAICAARNRFGEPCPKTPVKTTGKCRYHGGKSPGPKDQRGNTNAVKTGINATKTQHKLYEEFFGMMPDQEPDPLIRANRILMIQNYLLTRFAYNIQENPSIEDIERLVSAGEQLNNAEMKLNKELLNRLRMSDINLTKEQLDEMTPQERLRVLNNTLIERVKYDQSLFNRMFEFLTRSLKHEGDLKLKAEETKVSEFEDDIDLSIEGVDEDVSS